MTASDEYIYGSEDTEILRLSMQHRLWSDYCGAHWLRAGFAPGQTLLDLGAGPGFAATDLAELVGPEGRVVAVEPTERYAAYFRAELDAPSRRPRAPIDLQVGRAEDLALPPASLHGAYARWVFTFIPDLEVALRRIAEALRPGGRLALLDYFDWPTVTWGPRAETLPTIRAAVQATFDDFGADGRVGQRLPAAIVGSGLELLELRPVVRIARPADALWRWPEVWLESFLSTVIEAGHATEADHRAWREEWEANRRDPAGFFCTPTQVEIIARKPA